MNAENEYEGRDYCVKLRPVVGYEGLYGVTDDGRVWSVPRTVVTSDGRPQKWGGRWLKPSLGKGYEQVRLCKKGKCKTFQIHVLVSSAFIGPRPEGFHTDHIDRNPRNNQLNNLRYVTPSENRRNSEFLGYFYANTEGWVVQRIVEYEVIYRKRFPTEEEAKKDSLRVTLLIEKGDLDEPPLKNPRKGYHKPSWSYDWMLQRIVKGKKVYQKFFSREEEAAEDASRVDQLMARGDST